MTGQHFFRPLLWLGLAALIVGAVDPLEGSVLIVAGVCILIVAAHIGRVRVERLLDWGGALAVAGVALLFAISALGGVGGTTGRSYWWTLVLLPYPLGWLISLVGAVRALREH